MNIGFTFSQKQCKYLGIPYQETLEQLLTLPINTVRVCAYWNEIETEKGVYNWQTLDEIITKSADANKQIILTVGVKAPRWPEFHIPRWIEVNENTTAIDLNTELREHSSKFYNQTIQRYKDNIAIKYIQIENEPFNRLAFINNRYLRYEFVNEQLQKAKQIIPDKKFLLSSAINLKPFEQGREHTEIFEETTKKADAVGINVYTKVGIPENKYITDSFLFWWKLKNWFNHLKQNNKEAWITELQAEPWEHGSAIHTEQEIYPSASPDQTQRAFYKLKNIGFSNILLWGAEYWYWHKKQGRDIWWNSINNLVESNI